MNIFWTVLGEKQISGSFPRYDKEVKWLEISRVYYLNGKKEIVGRLNIKPALSNQKQDKNKRNKNLIKTIP
ncbi:MAG: hypothetical protein AABZ11_07265 [Nitrospinota bacterium]